MLIRVSRESLKQLAGRTNETAHLAIREGKHALFIDHATVNHVIAVSGQTGEMVPLYCTAHGKALLADFNDKELRSIFGRAPLQNHTGQTTRSVAQLAETCVQIKAQGYACDDGEYQEGVRCVAAPIRGARRHDHRLHRHLGSFRRDFRTSGTVRTAKKYARRLGRFRVS